MKIYLAGRIAGDRKYRAKFREAARALEGLGYAVEWGGNWWRRTMERQPPEKGFF